MNKGTKYFTVSHIVDSQDSMPLFSFTQGYATHKGAMAFVTSEDGVDEDFAQPYVDLVTNTVRDEYGNIRPYDESEDVYNNPYDFMDYYLIEEDVLGD